MLDMKQAEKLVAQLQKAEGRAHQPIDPALPIELLRARRETERAFAGAAFRLADLTTRFAALAAPFGAALRAGLRVRDIALRAADLPVLRAGFLWTDFLRAAIVCFLVGRCVV